MFIKHTHIIVCAALLTSIISSAQTKIHSIVKAKDSQEQLIGATVTNTKSHESTVTDSTGDFEIEVHDTTEELEISYVGYKPKILNLSNVSDVIYLTPVLENLDQVIVSASRTKEKKHNVPVAISVVTRENILETNPNDISEILNQKPGVFVADLGNEQHMSAIRQPITTKSVFLYLEDGLPIRPTGIFNHNALLETNSNAVENIEIIRGAYSSLYGSEAIGGAVNYITEKPSKELEIEIANRANNIGYNRFDAKISGTIGKTGLYLSGYRSSIVDGFREYGDFDKTAITAKITHEFSDKFNLEGALTYVDYFSESSGSIGEDAFNREDFSSVHSFTFRDAEALRASLTANYIWNDKSNTTAKLFYRDNTLGQNPSFRIDNRTQNGTTLKDGELNENKFESFGALVQHNVKVSDKFKFSIGGIVDLTENKFFAEELNVTRDQNGIFTSFEQLGTFTSDYKVDIKNIGTFFTGEYKITNQFRINGGLRVDAFLYDFKNNLSNNVDAPNTIEFFDAVTPRIGLVYNGREYGGYVNYSKGFIPPSVGELFRDPDVPNLSASTFDNYEIGTFSSFFDGALYIDLAVYYLRGRNEIVSVSTFDTVNNVSDSENRNTGGTQHYGIEHKIEIKATKELFIQNNGSISRHEFRDFDLGISRGVSQDFSENDIPGGASHLNNLQVSYRPKFLEGFKITPEWQSVGKYYTDNANTIDYEGYDVLNIRTGYKYKQMYFWANLMNVFDKNFATRANTAFGNTTFSPGNPRNITVGVRYSLK